MNRWELLGRTATPDGDEVVLTRHGSEFLISASGRPLMSSRMHGSEEALAQFGCERARTRPEPCCLVGGLGMGFTVRAALDVLPAGATVVVAELIADIVTWNRGPLAALAAHPLQDRRVVVEVGDVLEVMRRNPGRFDSVLLDVDNAPVAFTTAANANLYAGEGLVVLRASLKPGGVAAVWSAHEDRKFEQRLRHAGFRVRVERVRARLKKGGPRHVIFLGETAGV
ncbi:MAG: hypothetical protein U0Q55_22355 [Vicinamibacterales bacterium]